MVSIATIDCEDGSIMIKNVARLKESHNRKKRISPGAETTRSKVN